jgi:thymidylate kinase
MLNLLRDFFGGCTAAGIRYAIWKSLENLDGQLAGDGDIDVLFDPDQRDQVFAYLATHCFIFDSGSASTVGRDVLVYRGFDRASGVFVTLHVHFQCRFGSKTEKESRYAHEIEMFRDQVPYRGIMRLRDGHFFAIRLLTVAVRETAEDPYVAEIGRQYLAELPAADREILDRCIDSYFGCAPATLMANLAAGGANALHRYTSTVEAAIDRQEPRHIYARHANDTRKKPSLRFQLAKLRGRGRSKLDRPAAIVITGPDGAGKSTVCDLLLKKFSKLGPTYVLYLGRREWRPFNSVINRMRVRPGWSLILGPIWPLTSTAELLLIALKGWAHVWLGGYVIYDRSLFDNVLKFSRGYGPTGAVARAVSRACAARQGHLHFFLRADPEVALSRKPPGKYTRDYLMDVERRFSEILPAKFRTIDSSEWTAEEVCNEIVSDYFKQAVHWAGRP